MATITRPAGGYTPSNPITNSTKYQDDSAGNIAISSAKVDGDINKAFDVLTEHDDQLEEHESRIEALEEASVPVTEFADNELRVKSSSDATKKAALDVSNVAPDTTVTLSVQNKSGLIAVIETADLKIPGSGSGAASLSLGEDTDNGSSVVKLVAPAAIGADRTQSLQDADGTVALTSDLPIFTHATTNTQVSTTTNNTWIATGLQITVTPASSSKKVKLDISQTVYNVPAGAVTDTKFWLRLKRDSTVLQTWESLGTVIGTSGSANVDGINRAFATTYIDSPSTASAVTYSMEMYKVSPSGVTTLYAQFNNATPSNICATVF